jgi:hypothetical protein
VCSAVAAASLSPADVPSPLATSIWPARPHSACVHPTTTTSPIHSHYLCSILSSNLHLRSARVVSNHRTSEALVTRQGATTASYSSRQQTIARLRSDRRAPGIACLLRASETVTFLGTSSRLHQTPGLQLTSTILFDLTQQFPLSFIHLATPIPLSIHPAMIRL